MDEQDIIVKFANVEGFDCYYGWADDKKGLFREFINAVHGSELDIYKVNIPNEVRIGAKPPGAGRGQALAFLNFTKENPVFKWGIEPYTGVDLKQQYIDWFSDWKVNPNLVLENTKYNNGRYRGNHQGRLPIDYPQTRDDQVGRDDEDETQEIPMQPLNTILYGPPGTGKTYQLTQRAVDIIRRKPEGAAAQAEFNRHLISGRIEFTTFHQNYAYEDFIEGLRAQYDATNKAVVYRIESGILKRIAYRALHAWLTGQATDFELTPEQTDRVVDYLTGVKPPDDVNVDDIPNYVLIIDEINRGNVAKIMGEVITLVEDSKRARREGEFKDKDGYQPILATLPYTREKFILPPNLYIIGTMNTADRSLIGLDAALRRRFSFEELPPRPELLKDKIEGVDADLSGFLTNLNRRIENIELTRDHCIGHAYFMGIKNIDGLAAVMRQKVIPQLQEYFHDRPEELHDLLSVNGQSFVDKRGQINVGNLYDAALYNGF